MKIRTADRCGHPTAALPRPPVDAHPASDQETQQVAHDRAAGGDGDQQQVGLPARRREGCERHDSGLARQHDEERVADDQEEEGGK